MSYVLHKVRLYLYTLEFQSRFELLILFLIVISYPDLSPKKMDNYANPYYHQHPGHHHKLKLMNIICLSPVW